MTKLLNILPIVLGGLLFMAATNAQTNQSDIASHNTNVDAKIIDAPFMGELPSSTDRDCDCFHDYIDIFHDFNDHDFCDYYDFDYNDNDHFHPHSLNR